MKHKKNIIFISLLFFLSILLYFSAIRSGLPLTPASDAKQYYTIAHHWLDTGEIFLINNGLRAPAYPAFLILGFWLKDSLNFIYLLQFLLLAAISTLIFLIASKHLKMDFVFSALSALAVLFWPYFIFYATLLLSEMLFTFFLIAALYAYLNFLNQEKSAKAFLVIGALLALSSLTRPTTLLLPVWIMILAGFWQSLKNKRLSIERYHWPIITIFYILLIPWTAFASLHLGRFVPIASSGQAFLETAVGTKYEYTYNKDESYAPGQNIGVGKYLISKAKNAYRFWEPGANGYQAAAVMEKFPFVKFLINAYIVIFISMVLAALASIYYLGNIYVRYCWFFLLYFWAFHIISRPSPRFTLPVIPIAILLAIYSLQAIWKKWQQKTGLPDSPAVNGR